jgi:hypothetical protein
VCAIVVGKRGTQDWQNCQYIADGVGNCGQSTLARAELHKMRIVNNNRCVRNEAQISACAPRSLKLLLFAAIFLCFSRHVLAQTPDSGASDSNESWTATSDSTTAGTSPTRTIESHTQSGNHTVDVRSVQTRGSDGSLQPSQDVETQTVRVNATTTQTTTRTFVRDGNGAKTLFQITEEEKHTLSDGASKVVRTTSNPDANGNLQVVQREVRETQKTSPDVQETKTTVMLADINGGLAPVMQTEEHQKRNGNTVEIQKTTLLPDGSGGWQMGEVRQSTIKDEGKNLSSEERVSRPDSEGNLGEVTRTVGKETEDVSGEKRNSEETYSIDISGTGRDRSLRLVQRVTTTQHTNSASQQTTEQLEQNNPGNPEAGLRVTTLTTDAVRSESAGAQATRIIQMRDPGGSLGVISVDMTKSNNAHAIEVHIGPSLPK